MEKYISDLAKLEKPVKIYQKTVIESNVSIGKYTYVRPYTTIAKKVKIGRYCAIAENCSIGVNSHPTDWLSIHTFQYDVKTKFPGSPLYNEIKTKEFKEKQHTKIGNDVWIGSNVVILKGVTIGANAIVTKDVEDYTIIVGANKILKKRFNSEIIKELQVLKWWNLDEKELAKVVSWNNIEKAVKELKMINRN